LFVRPCTRRARRPRGATPVRLPDSMSPLLHPCSKAELIRERDFFATECRYTMQPVIRLARNSDIDGITSLVARYWDFESIPGFERSRTVTLLAEFLAQSQRGHCWVAEIDGDLVGYLLVVFVFSLEHGGLMVEIDEFFVVPEKRSLKVGAALLSEASHVMTRDGIAQLQLQLALSNIRGKLFYEAHGFRPLSGYRLWQKSLDSA
jgi:GNAT superfamily N-acetyltransferase